jgi:uncharacterized membrane protein YbhN (UPF0104 family)
LPQAGIGEAGVGDERDRLTSASVANNIERPRPSRGRRAEKIAMVAAKLLITGGCFWYVSRQIDWRQALSAIPLLDFRWAAFAILVAMMQIPLLGLRWRNILNALVARDGQLSRTAMIAATAVGVFFGQVLPNIAGDGMRAWLIIRLGCNWRVTVMSVVIDRAVGVGLLIVLAFIILLLPSGVTALGGYHDVVLIIYGALIFAGLLALLLEPIIVAPLARWRYSRWFATLAAEAYRVLLGSKGPVILGLGSLSPLLTIVVVWLVGQAQGFPLPLSEAAVLFTVMTGIALIPVSIGGWGLRELTVISILTPQGIAPERALLFSACFGLVVTISSLPGALVWLFCSLRQLGSSPSTMPMGSTTVRPTD